MRYLVLLLIPAVLVSKPAEAREGTLQVPSALIQLSFIDPEDAGSTLGFGVAVLLLEVRPLLHFAPRFQYWQLSDEVGGPVAFGDPRQKLQEFSLEANLRRLFETDAELQFTLGGGIGIYWQDVRLTIEDVSRDTTLQTHFGLNVFGGIQHPIGTRTDFALELGYKLNGLNTTRVSVGIVAQISE